MPITLPPTCTACRSAGQKSFQFTPGCVIREERSTAVGLRAMLAAHDPYR